MSGIFCVLLAAGAGGVTVVAGSSAFGGAPIASEPFA